MAIIHTCSTLHTNPDPNLPRGTNRCKYIAFHKGHLLPDNILDWIIDAAVRGKLTPSGAELLLLPDTRKGPIDSSGRRQIGKFRKSDCLTLKQLIRKIGKTETLPRKAKKTKNGAKNIREIKALKTSKIQKTRSGTTPSDNHFLHKEQGVNELKNASVQAAWS